jgi:protoporphyrinogen/coproporphyrinogen III oxidase
MKVVVVGGGVAGLAVAYRLTRAGAQVTVLEGAARWGGQIYTERVGRFVVEHGAEGYAAGRTSVRELCTTLGCAGRLVSQLLARTFVLRDGEMVPTPVHEAAELAGIQTDRADYGQGLTSLREGMGELTDALLAEVTGRAELRLGTTVTDLARTPAGWTVTYAPAAAVPEAVAADAVILATPAAVAAGLLAPISPAAAAELGSFETLSNVSVSLACPRRAVAHPLDGSGFVLPGGVDATGLRACTFVSSKFPGRAPRGRVLLRAFFRPGPTLQIEAPDERWVDGAVQSLWPALGVTAAPARAWVARWPAAIARYTPDHGERMARTLAALEAEAPGLELAGAAYRSAGVAGAIESAEDAVRRVLAWRLTPVQRYGSSKSDVS